MTQTITGLRELSEAVERSPEQLRALLQRVAPDLDASLDTIQAALKTLRESLSSLNGRGLNSAGTLTADVKDINAQFGAVSDALMDLFYDLENPGVDDRVSDTSAEDVDNVTNGKLRGSVNHAAVAGDINVGGAAGSMSIEYEFDPENDLLSDASFYRREYAMKAIVQACVSDGVVTARRDCAGSICGRVDLGLITQCVGLGSVESESGDYVGGVAGFSAGTIRDSFAKCALSGRRCCAGGGSTVRRWPRRVRPPPAKNRSSGLTRRTVRTAERPAEKRQGRKSGAKGG